MECMACSDNVVRAGLTPKYIDVETLCKMLDYSGKPLEKTKFKGKVSTDENGCKISKFAPPIWDFAVTEIEVNLIISDKKHPWKCYGSLCLNALIGENSRAL